MSGVKLGLARRLSRRDLEKAELLLEELQADAAEALDDLRDLSRGIYPPLLADQGLVVAIEAQARRAPIEVRVKAADVGRYGAETEAAVYFCVLEALQNVAKYANASHAGVRLNSEDGWLVFEVNHDGRGFDPDATSFGTGLQGMVDRLDALGGSLTMSAVPGRGASVTGAVPL